MEKAYWSRYPRSLPDQCGGTMYNGYTSIFRV